ncbi:DEAD/DEAH box helicase [Oscillatoria sp. FACHB-1406]|uniref:DEAD/DEAH box helicase n=1 Tax=Oscillatoria sp. FACHB-1406 TaxID=2692846 RepID=UPI001688CB68|nr:DEAD/DEAH box helicase [Oscillatoria sp. FACHB-1406]MBD2577049.1 DEAD/DEAH box helicase [Oscillatoria sp. FACHB-1406]
MAILHGSWLSNETHSSFWIWCETWRGRAARDVQPTAGEIPVHPFAMKLSELLAFCAERPLVLPINLEERLQTRSLYLPSYREEEDAPFLPLLSESRDRVAELGQLPLQRWQVEGIALEPQEAAQFLQAVPLGSLEGERAYPGGSLRFWAQVYRWSLDLVARCKFLPGLAQEEEGRARSAWYPLLDSAIDRARLAQMSRLMPAVCRAHADGEIEPQGLLLSFLGAMVNVQVRTWLEGSLKVTKPSFVQQWLQSLAKSSGQLAAEPEQLHRALAAIETWTRPIEDFVVTPEAKKLGGDRFQACFVLQPPSEGEVRWGKLDWKLNYCLQSASDPDISLDAATIWQYPVDELRYCDRVIANPQESLLQGLGLAGRLYAPILASLEQRQPTQCLLNPIEVYEFVRSSAWQLQDNGFGIILPPGLASGRGEKRLGLKIKAKVSRKKGERLGLKTPLNYQLELAVGDTSISREDFDRLLAQQSPLVEVDGEWLALQPADVRAAQAVLAPNTEPLPLLVEDALRLSTGETKTLAKLPVTGFTATGVLKELIDNLIDNKPIQIVETPEDFRGELRPYQSFGVSWLAFLEQWSFGACLADDMGLGKTPQFLAFLLHLKEKNTLQKPCLVVCPTSVIGNWEREIKKFSPTLTASVHHGDKRDKGTTFAKNIRNKDLVITSYSLLYRDIKSLETIDWEGVVLDEAQNIKNPQAKQAQAARSLKAGFRIALTGTPVENRLSELWSILEFLNPGFLGGQQFFQRRFAIPIEKYGDRDSLYQLRSLVRPFILRRLKTDKEIVRDLPEKQEMSVYCGLSVEQATLYQQLTEESLQKIDAAEGIERHGLILTLLLKLKQLCNHPAHYLKEPRLERGARSGKLLRLQEMLEEVLAEGEGLRGSLQDRALIFTQFAEWGKLLQPYLERQLKTEVLFLYGSTSRDRRQEMVDRFQHDPEGPRILILSLKAGGTGLNLTRANHVFHVDRWWNPAVENQATDRAFRIGQQRNVQVHKFVCTGTLEERIEEIINSKKQLAEQTVDAGEQWLTKLDTEQLRNLLLLDRSAILDEE